MKSKLYLVAFEFRYTKGVRNMDGMVEPSCQTYTHTVGVYPSWIDACRAGNACLEELEKSYRLNPHWNRRERFSASNTLISDLSYLQTPFSFFASIETLHLGDFGAEVSRISQECKNHN